MNRNRRLNLPPLLLLPRDPSLVLPAVHHVDDGVDDGDDTVSHSSEPLRLHLLNLHQPVNHLHS